MRQRTLHDVSRVKMRGCSPAAFCLLVLFSVFFFGCFCLVAFQRPQASVARTTTDCLFFCSRCCALLPPQFLLFSSFTTPNGTTLYSFVSCLVLLPARGIVLLLFPSSLSRSPSAVFPSHVSPSHLTPSLNLGPNTSRLTLSLISTQELLNRLKKKSFNKFQFAKKSK